MHIAPFPCEQPDIPDAFLDRDIKHANEPWGPCALPSYIAGIYGLEVKSLSGGLDELESLPTTESNRALWSSCDAKTARGVEGYRGPYRRDFCRHLRPPPRSHIRRLAARFSDCVSVLAGGLATVVILNFNQALGTCPALEHDQRWPTVLLLPRYLPPSLRCPSLPLYVAEICAYSAAGVVQIVREPKYWADCALVAVFAAVVTGAIYGVRSMVDALVLGGFLSLLCCRGIVWSRWRVESQLPG
ncbi:hypothetical protein C8A01DRAFT_36338 [Parachaetomium inaequale]|uniref:Uncharacterized protein n=1 Tax=Parachaetomium inaequale TaxID=2588326 RepID=A0AAN6SRU3_9PEZI|nr:hypothetical protein C8A01DRAFT_36338 [Parachaetomium inaequale]